MKAARMEQCAQCGVNAHQHPIAIIQALNLEEPEGIIYISDNNMWVARAICDACWHSPRLKGHFHYNDNTLTYALNKAGSATLGN